MEEKDKFEKGLHTVQEREKEYNELNLYGGEDEDACRRGGEIKAEIATILKEQKSCFDEKGHLKKQEK